MITQYKIFEKKEKEKKVSAHDERVSTVNDISKHIFKFIENVVPCEVDTKTPESDESTVRDATYIYPETEFGFNIHICYRNDGLDIDTTNFNKYGESITVLEYLNHLADTGIMRQDYGVGNGSFILEIQNKEKLLSKLTPKAYAAYKKSKQFDL